MGLNLEHILKRFFFSVKDSTLHVFKGETHTRVKIHMETCGKSKAICLFRFFDEFA